MIPKFPMHLLSGGLDSTTLLYDLVAQGCQPHCVLFDYKQRHAQELLFARAHCGQLGILYTTLELPALGGLTEADWVVPNRNAIMLSLAVNLAIKAGADCVTFAANADDAANFPDCRPEFVQAMNTAVKAAGYHIEICVPYIDWPKCKIARRAKSLFVDTNQIWSCYVGGAHPCGKCPACLKLAAALKDQQ